MVLETVFFFGKHMMGQIQIEMKLKDKHMMGRFWKNVGIQMMTTKTFSKR